MPRNARLVVPGVAHHITQRGTNRQTTFFSNSDRRVYLDLLALHSAEAGLRIVAYCLMFNHIHLIVIPERESSMAVALRRVHGRYAQYLNTRKQRSGHLWQNRYFSCPLTQDHLWPAIRYVEQNPVRAHLTALPGEYIWSSAAEHLNGRAGRGLTDRAFYEQHGGVESWRELHSTLVDSTAYASLRDATYGGKAQEVTASERLGTALSG